MFNQEDRANNVYYRVNLINNLTVARGSKRPDLPYRPDRQRRRRHG